MFTLVKDGQRLEFDELVDVLLRAEVNDPVYVPGRGWMAVGDLRPASAAGGPAAPAAGGVSLLHPNSAAPRVPASGVGRCGAFTGEMTDTRPPAHPAQAIPT